MIRSSLFFLSIGSLNGGEKLEKSDGNLRDWIHEKLAFEKIDVQMRITKKPGLRKSGLTAIKKIAPPPPPGINSSSTTSLSLENTLDR